MCRCREADLDGHITHEDAAPDPDASEEDEDSEEVELPDLQLDRALEVLKSWTYFQRLGGSVQVDAGGAAEVPTTAAP